MTIKSLLKILSPPARNKRFASAVAWAKAEKTLGAPLPRDWRDFCINYGGGTIGGFAAIFNPAEAASLKILQTLLRNYNEERERALTNMHFQYVLQLYVDDDYFPQPMGLIPFGQTDQRQTFYFVRKGKPDQWPIAIWDDEMRTWHEHRKSLTTFLTALLQGESLSPFDGGWKNDDEPLVFRN